ncbi:response regulator [Paracoccus albicereus]|nr:response regulator transcription factor [Paracoccus albicereus]
MIVDDHPVVREGYRRLIDLQPGLRIVAEADDARSAYARYRDTAPDVVVMDVTIPGASGIEAIRHIRQYDRHARIVVFTMHHGSAYALKSFEAGAAGYVTKSSEPQYLIRAILGALSAAR